MEQDAESRIFPCSFSQQRLWFIQQMDPANIAYNEPLLLKITGNLSVKALESALQLLVQRHSALRTTFLSEDEETNVTKVSSIDP